MAINVNENGTIKEIGTKINGFTIDEVDLLLDNYWIDKGKPSQSISVAKYRFLVAIAFIYDINTTSARDNATRVFDLDMIRRHGHTSIPVALSIGTSGSNYMIMTVNNTDPENAIVWFKHYQNSPVAIVTAIGIACSTTE